jgi:hypothetical protein
VPACEQLDPSGIGPCASSGPTPRPTEHSGVDGDRDGGEPGRECIDGAPAVASSSVCKRARERTSVQRGPSYVERLDALALVQRRRVRSHRRARAGPELADVTLGMTRNSIPSSCSRIITVALYGSNTRTFLSNRTGS